jgi:hypothetical protein
MFTWLKPSKREIVHDPSQHGHSRLPGYRYGYGSARFLKRQDPDTARIRQVQKYIIIIFKFEKYISKVKNQNIMNHNIRTEII